MLGDKLLSLRSDGGLFHAETRDRDILLVCILESSIHAMDADRNFVAFYECFRRRFPLSQVTTFTSTECRRPLS